MLSDFQRTKLAHQFRLFDADADGNLTRDDFVRVFQTLAHARGLDKQSAEYLLLKALHLAMWEPIVGLADTDSDRRVTAAEFLALHEALLDDPLRADEVLPAFANTLFDILDGDRDGAVVLAEYEQYTKALGIEGTPASWFPRLDTNSDGQLTKEEVRVLVGEFYRNDEPEAAGNWFFGPL